MSMKALQNHCDGPVSADLCGFASVLQRVEGHTDPQALHPCSFPSAEEFSLPIPAMTEVISTGFPPGIKIQLHCHPEALQQPTSNELLIPLESLRRKQAGIRASPIHQHLQRRRLERPRRHISLGQSKSCSYTHPTIAK